MDITPSSRPVVLLRFAILLRGIGLAQKYVWSSFETETSIFGMCYFNFGWNERFALGLDTASVRGYLIAGVMLVSLHVIGPSIEKRGLRESTRKGSCWLLAFCTAWEILLVIAIVVRDDAFRRYLPPATHALRIAVPLALFERMRSRPLDPNAGRQGADPFPIILRTAIAITFLGHGWNAWLSHPEYVTYLLTTSQNLLGLPLNQSSVETMLRMIAIGDVAGALALVSLPSRSKGFRLVVLYLTSWGFITAASRVTSGGTFVLHETLLRASHFLGPAALLAYCSRSGRPDTTQVSLDRTERVEYDT